MEVDAARSEEPAARSIKASRNGERDGDEAALVELGAKIRARRAERRLTLEALAQSAGVSRSLISQVERGLASPSLQTLRRVSEALGVPVAEFFLGTGENASPERMAEQRFVVRASERKRMVARRAMVTYELLTPDINRNIEFLRGEFEPGSIIPSESGSWAAHTGEENVLCLDGSLTFHIGRETFELNEGDSISFDCSVPHQIRVGDRPTVVIVAITPPSF